MNPSARLDIKSNAGQTESLMRLRVSDATSDYFQIANSTGTGGQFIPLLKGFHQTDNRYALSIMGSTSDVMDNGNNALINFNARRTNSAIQNRPLFVWTNYDQKLMTMDAKGSVGIGTNSPKEKLHVEGDFLLNAYQTGGKKGLFFRQNFTDSKIYNLSILTYDDGDNSPDALDINAYDGIYFNTGSNTRNPRMKIDGNGKVGIGTVTPVGKLDIEGSVTLATGNEKLLFSSVHRNGTDNRSLIAPRKLNNNDDWDWGQEFGYHNHYRAWYFDGNLGIGTFDTKGYKLGVKGKIAAEEVKVAVSGNWPDYVFEENYNLPSLEEVESHIQENGHLENIPSAKEVEKNGIHLGEMNAKLLEKIEELTLYMIEQNKKKDALQKEVENLKKQNEALAKRIK